MPPSTRIDHKARLGNPAYAFINTEEQLTTTLIHSLVDLLKGSTCVGVDTETTGLDPRVNQVRLIQIASPEFALIVDLDAFRTPGERQVDWTRKGLSSLASVLEGSFPKVLQNAAFDLNFLKGEGIDLGGEIFDTMVASKIINNGTGGKNDLGTIVSRDLGVVMPKELQKADWSGEITEDMLVYAARDALCLPLLMKPLASKLLTQMYLGRPYMELFQMEMRCLRPIALMQWYGFGFNLDGAKDLKMKLEGEATEREEAFLETLDVAIKKHNPEDVSVWLPRNEDGSFNTNEKTYGSIRLGTKVYAGFNARSPKQMAERFTQAGVILPPGAKGEASMDKNLLSFIRGTQPLVDAYMTWKAGVTRVSHIESLIDAFGPDGRIHAGYRQMGTDTGRLSCAGPNLQQVPREAEFRSLFQAEPGHTLVVADFSQVELRVAAQLSGEERMREAYRQGRDLHIETAALVTGKEAEDVTKAERTSAKICFSLDTEVLTPDGWVALADYDGQRVAQYELPVGVELNKSVTKPGPGYVAGLPAAWDGNNGELNFVYPDRFETFFSTQVWHSSDRNHDVVATGNHNILYIDAYGNAKLKPLVEVSHPRHFVAAGYLRSRSVLSTDQSRLLAMVVADGSFKSQQGYVRLGFSKRRKIHRCQELLNTLGIEFKRATYSNGDAGTATHFTFELAQAPWLLTYTTVDKKLIAWPCLHNVDKLAYLAEAQYWDGVSREGTTRDRVRVGTSVKVTADTMQSMAVTSGLPCTVHTETLDTGKPFYIVSYAFRTAPTWRPSWNPKLTEAQEVGCVQVPSGLLLIRRNGKACIQGNCNFGLLYGSGPATLRKQAIAQYGVDMSHEEAVKLVNGFRAAYPTLKAWQDTEGNKTTASVFTKLGRRRRLQGFNDKYTTRINTQVQGTAGDIAKLAICKLWDWLKRTPEDEAKLIAMVHDEIVLEVRSDCADLWSHRLVKAMESAGSEVCEDVPIVSEASSGSTWADAK